MSILWRHMSCCMISQLRPIRFFKNYKVKCNLHSKFKPQPGVTILYSSLCGMLHFIAQERHAWSLVRRGLVHVTSENGNLRNLLSFLPSHCRGFKKCGESATLASSTTISKRNVNVKSFERKNLNRFPISLKSWCSNWATLGLFA